MSWRDRHAAVPFTTDLLVRPSSRRNRKRKAGEAQLSARKKQPTSRTRAGVRTKAFLGVSGLTATECRTLRRRLGDGEEVEILGRLVSEWDDAWAWEDAMLAREGTA